MNYLTVPLDKLHLRKSFSCGNEILDRYIQKQVSQDIKRKLCICFILEGSKKETMGYYTLSNNSVPLNIVPEEVRKKMPKSYLNLPTTLLGRLAVDLKYAGKGYGKMLLLDSLKRSYDASKNVLGSMAVIVDPIDENAEKFYLKYGFIKLADNGKMFLSMNTVSKLFE